ncbi:MAG TPA: glycosyltransferase [Rickettsiales bacterium]|nr:glycosyltransferase [Rickettsiales bacterium]
MTEMQPPRLTVIIAVRNAVSTISRALDSLIAQHYPNLEIIVYDGLSDDGTVKVLEHYAHVITVLKSERDNGPTDGYRKGIALATGEYIGRLNADDVYEPGTLWAVADNIVKYPDAELFSFGMICRVQNRRGQSKVQGYFADERQLDISLESVLSENPISLLPRFIRKSLFQDVGAFNLDRKLWYYSSDREWMARLALRGCKNVIIPHALYGLTYRCKSPHETLENSAALMEEHTQIAQSLLARSDLTARQKDVIVSWQCRQLAIGFWQALLVIRLDKAETFVTQGIACRGWKFVPLSLYLLIRKLSKTMCLWVCGGINRGI